MGKRRQGVSASSGGGDAPVAPPHKKQRTTAPAAATNDAVGQLPTASIDLAPIPPYHRSLTSTDSQLPSLPAIQDDVLAATPFKHSSLVQRKIGTVPEPFESYERLEFLGDAYLELFATRQLFHRFASRTPPEHFTRLLQVRESMVNNETLAGFAKLYGFLDKLQIAQKEQFVKGLGRDSKRLVKILGDSFEAFVAAVALDTSLGTSFAENWMEALWQDRVNQLKKQHALREVVEPAREPNIPHDQSILETYHEAALEYLGGAYIEAFATRIVYARFEKVSAGRMSQITEVLIKNESLARLAEDLASPAVKRIQQTYYRIPKDRIKALAGSYKSHIGQRALHEQDNLDNIELDLLGSWAQRLVEEMKSDRNLRAHGVSVDGKEAVSTYDPNAKALLQKRVLGAKDVKLDYKTYQASIELKGAQLGQNRHYIACYLTGYGYRDKLLGKGEGKSKAEAGTWAAMNAMYGEMKDVVDQCEVCNHEQRARRKAEKQAQADTETLKAEELSRKGGKADSGSKA